MPALIFLVIATAGENLFGFLSQLAYNSGILSKFAIAKGALTCPLFSVLPPTGAQTAFSSGPFGSPSRPLPASKCTRFTLPFGLRDKQKQQKPTFKSLQKPSLYFGAIGTCKVFSKCR